MSLGEKLYLVMIVSLFASFMVLSATLCWLDAKEEKIKRWQDRKAALATQRTPVPATVHPQTALHGG